MAPPVKQQLQAQAKPFQKLLLRRLLALRTNPRPPGVTKLEGLDHLYRIREGDYRIIYTFREKELLVLAIKNGVRAVVRRSPKE